jgi:hypothetical protein
MEKYSNLKIHPFPSSDMIQVFLMRFHEFS